MASASLPLPCDDEEKEEEEDEENGANDSAGAIASESPRRFEARIGDFRADADEVGELMGPTLEEKDECEAAVAVAARCCDLALVASSVCRMEAMNESSICDDAVTRNSFEKFGSTFCAVMCTLGGG